MKLFELKLSTGDVLYICEGDKVYNDVIDLNNAAIKDWWKRVESLIFNSDDRNFLLRLHGVNYSIMKSQLVYLREADKSDKQ